MRSLLLLGVSIRTPISTAYFSYGSELLLVVYGGFLGMATAEQSKGNALTTFLFEKVESITQCRTTSRYFSLRDYHAKRALKMVARLCSMLAL